ncbi:glycosyltransferase family 2 protein [Vibrio sp.]|uniref:glycosyltransferase family 2 protein n=1 Tax=Vibrio sp. TaxID=678 RepID=UPI00311D3D11
MKTFTIVVPVYQNAQNLEVTIPRLLKLTDSILTKLNIKTKLMFVDDGSTDSSYEILRRFCTQYKEQIEVLKLSRNFGQTPAIQAGLAHSKSDCTGIISADLQDPPEIFIEMLTNWLEGEKYIIAERVDRVENFTHRFISSLYWRMVAKYSMRGFPRGGYDFCLVDKQLASLVSHTQEKNTSIFPLLFWFGFEPKVLSYQRQLRDRGTSTWTFVKKVRITIDTLIGFTYLPTRMISFSAISTSFLALLYTFYVLGFWLLGDGSAPDGWTSIALLILIIGGVVLFGLGVICEYLLRILDEVRSRPNFIVESHLNHKGNINEA